MIAGKVCYYYYHSFFLKLFSPVFIIYYAPKELPAGDSRQLLRCVIPQAVNSLVLQKMGEIIDRNMLS